MVSPSLPKRTVEGVAIRNEVGVALGKALAFASAWGYGKTLWRLDAFSRGP